MLSELLTSLAVRLPGDAAKGVVARALKGRTEPERTQALAAFDQALAAFFERYGTQFGGPSSSFLAGETNWERTLGSVSPARPLLDAADLTPDGFDGAAAATPEAIAAFVDAFHEAIADQPALAPTLASKRMTRQAQANWDTLHGQVEALVSAALTGPALVTLSEVDRARWMCCLRSTAQRATPRRPSVPLDALLAAETPGLPTSSAPSASRVSLSQTIRDHPALVLAAPPGSGKTVAAHACLAERAVEIAAGGLRAGTSPVRHVPVFVEPGPGSLFVRIAHALHAGGLGGGVPTEAWVHEALAAGALWVCVDDAHRLDDPREIADLAAYTPASRLLVLGRDVPTLSAAGIPRASVAPLSFDQQIAVLDAHLPPSEDEVAPYRILSQLGSAAAVRERPLTLALVGRAAAAGAENLSDRREVFRMAFRHTVGLESPRTDALADADVQARLLGAVALRTLCDPALGYRFAPLDVRAALAESLRDLAALGVELSVDTALDVLRESHALTQAAGGRLSFAHDQWQEFFAAEELVRSRGRLSSVSTRDSRREVALFAASVRPNPARPEFWWTFWHDLVLDDLATASDAVRAAKQLYPDHGERTDPLSQDEATAAFEAFLTTYEAALAHHAPRLRSALQPHAPGRLGLRILDGFGSFLGPGVPMVAVVGRDSPSIAAVRFVEGSPFLSPAEPGVSWPRSTFSLLGLRSRTRTPGYLATRHLLRGIQDAWADRAFWEPDALLLERAFYEGAALAAASAGNAAREGALPESIDVEVLQRSLRGAGLVLAPPPRKGGSGLWSPRSASFGQPTPPLTVEAWEQTLAELQARSLTTSVLRPPVVPPRHLILASPYTDADRGGIIEWSLDYVRQTYETVHALLAANLPTAASAISPYPLFPAVVTLVPEHDPVNPRSLNMGSMWVWPAQDPLAPLVEVRLAEPEQDLFDDASLVGGWTNTVWDVPLGGHMPLYDAVYDAVGQRLDGLGER